MSASERRPTPSRLPADLRARVLAEVARAPSPTRREHRTKTALVAAGGVLATAALFFATGGLRLGARPVELVAFTAGLGLVAALVLTRVSARARGSMLGRPRHVLVLGAALGAPALAIVALAAAALWPGHGAEDVPSASHLSCGLLTILQGMLPFAVLLLPRRGTDPVHPMLTGAALGMAAGTWTAMMAYLRCPHAAALHCMEAHVLPTLLLAAAGALVGRKLLQIR